MKKITAFIMMFFIVLSMTSFASDSIKVKLDGKTISFDVEPQIVEGRTMVPLRAIFEAMGAEIEWDEELGW